MVDEKCTYVLETQTVKQHYMLTWQHTWPQNQLVQM